MDFLSTPETVAVAGDWHGNEQAALRGIAYAADRGATHLLHLGDFGYTFTERFLAGIQDCLFRREMVLGFVEGNHDNYDWLNAQPIAADGARHLRSRIVHLPRGFRWTWGDLTFMALGGAHSVDRQSRQPGISWWSGETMTHEEALWVAAGGPADVMICHDCPDGVSLKGLAPAGMFPAAEILLAGEHRQLLRYVVDRVRPRALWHGHYHAHQNAILVTDAYCTQIHGLADETATVEANVRVCALGDLARGGN